VARLSKLRLRLVRRFVYEPELHGLAVVLKALQFESEEFSAIFLLVRGNQTKRAAASGELEKALEFYNSLSEDACAQVLSWWQLEEGYLAALRALSEAMDPAKPSNKVVPTRI
jgi:hypothetical protein